MRFLDTTGLYGLANEYVTPYMFTGFLAGGFPAATPINPITPSSTWNGTIQHLPAPQQDYSLQGTANWPYNAIGHCSEYPFVVIEDNFHEITVGCGTLDPAWISKVVFYLHGHTTTVTQQTQNIRTPGVYGYSITPQSGNMNGPALLTWDIYPVNGYVRRGSLYIHLNSNSSGTNYYTRPTFYVDSVNGSDTYNGATFYTSGTFNSSTNNGPFKTIYKALTLGTSSSYTVGNAISNDGAIIYVEPNQTYTESYNGGGMLGNVGNIYNNIMVNIKSRINGQNYTITRSDRLLTTAYSSLLSTSGTTYTVSNYSNVGNTTQFSVATNISTTTQTSTTSAAGTYTITLNSVAGLILQQNISVLSSSGTYVGVPSGTFITNITGLVVTLSNPIDTGFTVPSGANVYSFTPNNLIVNPNTNETRYIVKTTTPLLDVPFLLGNTGSGGDLSSLSGWKSNTLEYIFPTNKTAIDGAIFDMSSIISFNGGTTYRNAYVIAGNTVFLSNCHLIDPNGYAGPAGLGLFYTSSSITTSNIINFSTPYTKSINTTLYTTGSSTQNTVAGTTTLYFSPTTQTTNAITQSTCGVFLGGTLLAINGSPVTNASVVSLTSINITINALITVASGVSVTFSNFSLGANVYAAGVAAGITVTAVTSNTITISGSPVTLAANSQISVGYPLPSSTYPYGGSYYYPNNDNLYRNAPNDTLSINKNTNDASPYTVAWSMTGATTTGTSLTFPNPYKLTNGICGVSIGSNVYLGSSGTYIGTVVSITFTNSTTITIGITNSGSISIANADMVVFCPMGYSTTGTSGIAPVDFFGMGESTIVNLTPSGAILNRNCTSSSCWDQTWLQNNDVRLFNFNGIKNANFYGTYHRDKYLTVASTSTQTNSITYQGSADSANFAAPGSGTVGGSSFIMRATINNSTTFFKGVPDGQGGTQSGSSRLSGMAQGARVTSNDSTVPANTYVILVSSYLTQGSGGANGSVGFIYFNNPVTCTSSTILTFTYMYTTITWQGSPYLQGTAASLPLPMVDCHFLTGNLSTVSFANDTVKYMGNYAAAVDNCRYGDYHILSINPYLFQTTVVGDLSGAATGDKAVLLGSQHADAFQPAGGTIGFPPYQNIYYQGYKVIGNQLQPLFIDQGQNSSTLQNLPVTSGSLISTSGNNFWFTTSAGSTLPVALAVGDYVIVTVGTLTQAFYVSSLGSINTDGGNLGTSPGTLSATTSVPGTFTIGTGSSGALVKASWSREIGITTSNNVLTASSPWNGSGTTSFSGVTVYTLPNNDMIQLAATPTITLSTNGTTTVGTNTLYFTNTAGIQVGSTATYASGYIPVGVTVTAVYSTYVTLSGNTSGGIINSGSSIVFNPVFQSPLQYSYARVLNVLSTSSATMTQQGTPLLTSGGAFFNYASQLTGTNSYSDQSWPVRMWQTKNIIDVLWVNSIVDSTIILEAGQIQNGVTNFGWLQCTWCPTRSDTGYTGQNTTGVLAPLKGGVNGTGYEAFQISDSIIGGVSGIYFAPPGLNATGPYLPPVGFNFYNNVILGGTNILSTTPGFSNTNNSFSYASTGTAWATTISNGFSFDPVTYQILGGVSETMYGLNGTGVPRFPWRYSGISITSSSTVVGAN